jgi:triacylglycerol esterase/lipase EstA (alpha/beta hydrolase family)
MTKSSRVSRGRSNSGWRRWIRLGVCLTTVLAAIITASGTATAATANDAEFAPLDRPGPALDVPPAALSAALHCQAGVTNAAAEPVLLSPGTGNEGDQQYGGNWEPALTALGIPWCAFNPPDYALGDIQTTGEYLVYAIRTMHQLAGRPIAILGHSQGGMSMRWALRFWPDTRPMVADVVGLAGDNHGSIWQKIDNVTACVIACPPVNYQQAVGSNFLTALNSYAETFAGIAYTEVHTNLDEIVDNTPPLCSSCLSTGAGQITNVAIQSVCPNDLSEHVGLYTDLVAYHLVVDAITHAGPAQPSAVPSSVCTELNDNADNPLTQQPSEQNPQGLLPVLLGAPGDTIGAPEVTAEPGLAPYVFAE